MSSTLHLVTVFDPALLSHAIHDDDPQVGADGWFPFGDVRPQVDDDRGISSAVCSASQNGDLHVCAIDVAGNLVHTIRFAADGTWQPYWGDVQSQIPQGPDIGPDSAVACAANQAGDLHVCAIGTSGTLWHTIRSAADGTWQPYWGDVQSQTSAAGPVVSLPFSGVSCSTSANDDLHVCCVTVVQGQTTDGQIWYTLRQAGGDWSDFDYVQEALNVIGSNALNASISHA